MFANLCSKFRSLIVMLQFSWSPRYKKPITQTAFSEKTRLEVFGAGFTI